MTRTTLLDREVGQAMSALSATAKNGLADPWLAELVAIRASQLNHCAFCLDMHLAIARRQGPGQGVPSAGRSRDGERQLDLLGAWEEAEGVYDERERAALALTEAVTVLTGDAARTTTGGGFVPDEVYERAAKHFDEVQLAHLVGLIVAINNWNRVMVARRITPGSPAW